MWSSQAVCIVCILFGIISDVRQVCSQPRVRPGGTSQSPTEATKLEKNIQKVIHQIHSLSKRNKRSINAAPTEEPMNLNASYGILNNLYGLVQPLMTEGYMNNLPETLVCILSERQDCGHEAELTKMVSREFGQPLLTAFLSTRSQTCSPLTSSDETSSLFGTYFNIGDMLTSLLSSFKHTFIDMLTSLSLSEDLINIVSALLNSTATYVLKLVAMLVDAPTDYVNIALQFGIQVPAISEEGTCTQGDLKQLIMWGLRHNVSWSFSLSLIDILLETLFPPNQLPYMFPEQNCQTPSSNPLQNNTSATNYTHLNYEIMCDDHSLASLNDTLCADILVVSGSSESLFAFCQALSSLSSSKIQQVWRNMCYIVEAIVSSLVVQPTDCPVGVTLPPPFVASLYDSPSAPHRVARDTSNLQQPSCNYSSWSGNSMVNSGLVSLCSVNDRTGFVTQVCSNSVLMKKLLSDQINIWLYGYCANSSVDPGYLVSQFCVYDQWIVQPPQPVDPALLGFCMGLDRVRLSSLICEHTGFLMLLLSNPDNWLLMPNCSNAPPPPPFYNPNPFPLDACQYSQWSNVMQITTDILSECILYDQAGFTKDVCANQTFLNALLRNKDLSWLGGHCSAALASQPPEPTVLSFNWALWCDYQTWGQQVVDDSIVAFCWQNDQISFFKNVCCKASVIEKLLENPLNQWLTTSCTNVQEITIPPQMCRYSDWALPIIVDMTDIALCADIDPLNFTSKVCANNTVLQNLLANQDNNFLISYCANHSSIPPGGGGGHTVSPTVFEPAEQCVYTSWITSPPNATLLTKCWEQDQASFISLICPNTGLLLLFSQELSKDWVSSICRTYNNYTATTNNTTTTANNDTTTTPDFCLATTLMKQFKWICPNSFISDCQPCATQNMVVQMILRCWVENLSLETGNLLTAPVTEVLNQAVSTSMVILLAVEDSMGPIWHVHDIIRPSVLQSVINYLKTETNQDNKRVLLQCFGTLLSSLLQTAREMSTDAVLFVKEYFNLPVSILRPVLTSADIATIRLILQYYTSFRSTQQLSNEYLSTMVSVLLQTQLAADNKIFPEMIPLLVAASPADIQTMPPFQSDSDVRDALNRMLDTMSQAQKEALGLWYSNALSPANITSGPQSLIRDTGDLIAYLPFQTFQHLSAAQLLDGLDLLQRNSLTSIQQEFIANQLIRTYKNLTAQDFLRLGTLACLADPGDLLAYKNTDAFPVIQDIIMNCTLKGLSMPSQMISNFVLNNPQLQVPSSLSADRLSELAPLLPTLGVTFLQGLTASQLLAALPALSSVSFTPAQASVIVDKLSSNTALIPGQMQDLGSLILGLRAEILLTFTSDKLLLVSKALSKNKKANCLNGLRPPEANVIATKLWGFPEVVNWLSDVVLLLRCTPLLSVMPRIHPLVQNLSNTTIEPWNTQQAEAIFNDLLNTNPNLIKQNFVTLGTLGQGVSCKVLKDRFQADSTLPSVRKILALLRQQPGLLHTSLKSCVIDVLYQFNFFSELLQDLGVEIALSVPLSIVKNFPTDVMDTLRKMIIEKPHFFLMMSRTKQELLVDKVLQRLGMYTGMFTAEEFLSLGIMASFVADEVFIQVDRSFFIQNLDYIKSLCYSSSKMDMVSRILQEPAVFGSVKNWTQATLSQVERFIFFLPTDVLQDISLPLMTVGQIEKLFMSQHQWERGGVGTFCLDQNDKNAVFAKEQFVLQFFLGFLTMNYLSVTPMAPTCEILHTTAPSAWTSSSLSSMSTSAFSNCLELMGLDPFMATYQRSEVLKRVKKIYGPVSSFPPSLIAQLGGIATELTADELSTLRLMDRRSISSLGAINIWTSKQLTALFTTVLNATKKSPSQLDSSMLVSMGYIVCGAKTTEIKFFNNVEFSKAVLYLGRLRLPCSEDQMLALNELLTNSLAFGLISSWDTDVFIEIGVLAAGLPDIATSALVKEQIDGISPLAISMIPPNKFAVVFSQKQIAMFSYEQAVAVTPQQIALLSDVQETALAMVLNPSEGKPLDTRGRPQGSSLSPSPSPLCLILGLLMLLNFLFCPDT